MGLLLGILMMVLFWSNYNGTGDRILERPSSTRTATPTAGLLLLGILMMVLFWSNYNRAGDRILERSNYNRTGDLEEVELQPDYAERSASPHVYAPVRRNSLAQQLRTE